MIELVDSQVHDWLKDIVDGAAISFSRPSDDAEKLVLYVYLFDIERPQAVASGRTPPVQLHLAYLLTCSGPEPIAAHALLSKVITAADGDARYSLEFGPPTAAAWAALNLPARASFILRATASQERDERLAPSVRKVQLDSVPLESVTGRVVATDGTPLTGVSVEVLALGRSTTTNADGRFTLDGLTNAVDLSIRVRAKDRQIEARRPAHTAGDFTVVVDFAGKPS